LEPRVESPDLVDQARELAADRSRSSYAGRDYQSHESMAFSVQCLDNLAGKQQTAN
jgi:hypothetical protein